MKRLLPRLKGMIFRYIFTAIPAMIPEQTGSPLSLSI